MQRVTAHNLGSRTTTSKEKIDTFEYWLVKDKSAQ